MFIYFITSFSLQIDLLLNKKLLLRSIPYNNFILTEDISDFSPNPFFTKNITQNLSGYNKIIKLEKEDTKYKLKIGSYYVCHDPTVSCNTNLNKCIDQNYKEVDCDVCKNKFIKVCQDKIDLWDIELTPLGYNIKQKNNCLTLGFKLILDECKGSKDQLFGFEDYTLKSCIEEYNFNKIPETRKEMIESIKMNKLNRDNPNIKKSTDEILEELVPGIEKKPKMKKLWGSLWNYGFSGINMPRGFGIKMLCGKWW